MSKFSTPLLFVFAILAAVAISGWRSAAGKVSGATSELTTTSNKLAEVTAKLAEQGAAAETLRVQLGLQKTDISTASNQVAAASVQLSQQMNRVRSLESEIGNRDAQITSANRSNVLLRASISELEAQAQALQAALESTRIQVVEGGKKLETTASALNEAESSKAALLAKLNDPSMLRSQLKSATATPKSNAENAADARLMLKPDGSVEVVRPVTKVSATEPTAKSTKIVPVFDETPVGDTKSPKIILTY